MRGFVGRISHRDAVLANLNALLLCYPPKRQFADDFPALKSTLRWHFEDGVPAGSSALQIAAAMIANFLRQLDDGEKAAVHGALAQAGLQGFAALAERRVNGERESPRDRVTFVTELAGVAMFMAVRMADEGTIDRRQREEFAAKLAAEIGRDAGERDALHSAFGP